MYFFTKSDFVFIKVAFLCHSNERNKVNLNKLVWQLCVRLIRRVVPLRLYSVPMNWFLRWCAVFSILIIAGCSAVAAYATGVCLIDGIKLEQPDKTVLCAGSDAITLKAPNLPASYTWFWNGTRINGLNTNIQTVSKPGSYYARVRDNATGTEINTDTITITTVASPVATLATATPNAKLCERDSLPLRADGGIHYQWFFNSKAVIGPTDAVFYAKQPGWYSVTVTDANGCQANSAPLNISVQVRPKPVIDSIPPLCGVNNPIISLRASPSGGAFSGPGVNGNTFNPTVAGLGIHTLRYQAPPANGCPGDSGHRLVRVNPLPVLELPAKIVTSNLGIVTFSPVVQGNGPFTFDWQPTIWLSNPTQATIVITFPQHDTTYTVHVQDQFGCVADGTLRVISRSTVSIPDAFTPNNDHVNDTWKLPGIESFPQAEVMVMNRWGDVVFHAPGGYVTPFDGQLNGEPLPTGPYLYILKLSPEMEPMRGSLLLLR